VKQISIESEKEKAKKIKELNKSSEIFDSIIEQQDQQLLELSAYHEELCQKKKNLQDTIQKKVKSAEEFKNLQTKIQNLEKEKVSKIKLTEK